MSDQSVNIVERKPLLMIVLALLVILIGSVITAFIPLFMESMEVKIDTVRPYTALELEGRDIYIREGCNNCHTQTVRPLRDEVLRYGEFSKSGEFAYDRPFLWGSKRTGPDLARIGGKYPDSWHVQHMKDPRSIVKDSNMPAYPWLETRPADAGSITARMKALQTLGVPYTDEEIAAAPAQLDGKTEMDAMVAYLQVLGTMIAKAPVETIEEPAPAPAPSDSAQVQ
ncbi:MAG: cytochrome-c oxidase, cbb3-type subunit II [Bacteroidetes bacterium]|nr:cytochrome-c oxidase, cbb3-type subunit II [Bacteroidota bacterium]